MEKFDLTRVSRRVFLVLLLLCGIPGAVWADGISDDPDTAADRQLPDRTITGTVSDEQGNPLIGCHDRRQGCPDDERYDYGSGREFLADGSRTLHACS